MRSVLYTCYIARQGSSRFVAFGTFNLPRDVVKWYKFAYEVI